MIDHTRRLFLHGHHLAGRAYVLGLPVCLEPASAQTILLPECHAAGSLD